LFQEHARGRPAHRDGSGEVEREVSEEIRHRQRAGTGSARGQSRRDSAPLQARLSRARVERLCPYRLTAGRDRTDVGAGGESESADRQGRRLRGVGGEGGDELRGADAAHHQFGYALAARECGIRAQIARPTRANGISGMNIAKSALNTANRTAPTTNSMMNGSISRPNTRRNTNRTIRNGRRKGKKRRQNMPLFTGGCLQEFRRLELVGRP